jgi:phenylacetate-coenzyme A ligase PaaK-like adenylate-forming protein
MKNHIEKLAALQPTIIIGMPSMLIEIAKACENNQLKINPKKFI